MAKIKKVYSFKNAIISKDDDGKYILSEVTKDDSKDFDLSALLDGILGMEGISLSFGNEDEVAAIED